jgi:Immunity protein 35
MQGSVAAMTPAFPSDSWLILDDATIERDWGWVFFYDSKLHHDTRDFQYAVAGNAPLVVRRSDGAVLATCTHKPVEGFVSDLFKNGWLR